MLSIFLLTSLIFSQANLAPMLSTADQIYLERKDIEKAKDALKLYKNYLIDNPQDVEGLWRASMANYFVGHIDLDRSARKKYFKEGLEQAKKCNQEAKGKRVECHFWQATNLALLKKEEGPFSMAFGISDIIESYDKALKINPSYVNGGPYRMLAFLYFKAPGFLGGDEKKSYDYIKKAIENSPDEPMNSMTYIRFLVTDNKKDEAIKVAEEFKKKYAHHNFTLYESVKAYQKILKFIETKEVPPEN